MFLWFVCGMARDGPFPIPAVFWHCYDHPQRRPDPDRETALAAIVAAFPSWYFHSVCACGHSGYISEVGAVLDGWGERLVSELVAGLRCKRCGARPASVELVSRLDAHGDNRGPVRRVRLLG